MNIYDEVYMDILDIILSNSCYLLLGILSSYPFNIWKVTYNRVMKKNLLDKQASIVERVLKRQQHFSN